MIRGNESFLHVLLLILTLLATPAWAASNFGTVDIAEGGVNIVRDGKPFTPRQHDAVFEKDLLVTGANGELHITTADHGLIALRPNTRVRVEEYLAERGATSKFMLMLEQGRFRSVTGWIGRENPRNYRVRTVTAVIGVRGTDHEPAYVEREGSGLQPGTYDKVTEGETYIENNRGQVSVTPDQAGFAPIDAAPLILAAIPLFYQPGRFEELLNQRRDELLRQYFEKPMQFKEEAERARQDPRGEAERRVREKFEKWSPPGW